MKCVSGKCPSCGQTLPDPLPVDLPFRGLEAEIVRRVYAAGANGISSAYLFEALHANDRDGGPLSGVKTLHVQVAQINKKLRKIGKRIYAGAGRHAARYALIDIAKETPPCSEPS